MLTDEENLRHQAEHPIETSSDFENIQEYVIHLMHLKAYEEAAWLGQGKRTLDWGCNDGWGIEMMAKYGCEASGIDVSEHALDLARKRLGQDAELFLYDGKTSPIPSNQFDLVTSFQCIEHVLDYDKYLGEIQRVLKPGGIAVLTTPNALIRLYPGMKPWNPFHVREFSPDELQSLLANHFGKVQLQGLFANEPLYRIEITRCDDARRTASSPIAKKEVDKMLLRSLRKIVPTSFVRLIKRHSKIGQKPSIPTYSTEELFYRNTNLDAALDLMATCHKLS